VSALRDWLSAPPKETAARHRPSESSAPVWVILLLMMLPVLIYLPGFFAPRNLSNAMVQMIPLALVALGQTVVILGGGIDLSVGALVSLITVIASLLMTTSPLSISWTILAALVVGAIGGAGIGLILKYFSIPPLIVTLAVGYIYQGIALALNDTTGGFINPAFSRAVTTNLFGFLPVPIVIFVIAYVALSHFLGRTPWGRWVYALGGDEEVLKSAGGDVNRVRISTYVVSGLLCAIAALYIAARLKSGNAYYGDEYMLLTIAAVVVGGTSLAGGRGTLIGTVAGVMLVSVFNNLLNVLGFRFNLQSGFYKGLVIGSVLIIAMLVYGRTRRATSS
jgi:ribose transport system permease protein